jgi:hypothetical protein
MIYETNITLLNKYHAVSSVAAVLKQGTNKNPTERRLRRLNYTTSHSSLWVQHDEDRAISFQLRHYTIRQRNNSGHPTGYSHSLLTTARYIDYVRTNTQTIIVPQSIEGSQYAARALMMFASSVTPTSHSGSGAVQCQ